MAEIIITGELTDIDGQNALVQIGGHRITGLDRDQLKTMAAHLYERVRVTIAPMGNMDVARVIKLTDILSVRRDDSQENGLKITTDEGLQAALFEAPAVLIESDNGFWREGGAGYCFQETAGRFTGPRAYASTSHCGPEKAVRFHLLAKVQS